MESVNNRFNIFFIFFIVMFVISLSFIVFVWIKMLKIWHKNNNSPRLTVDAEVVAKRTSFSNRGSSGEYGSTSYYATFQFDSGDRLELHLSGQDYGMIMEGDKGKLSFQGTRFLGFDRYM